MVKCGYCKELHGSVADVRACASPDEVAQLRTAIARARRLNPQEPAPLGPPIKWRVTDGGRSVRRVYEQEELPL